MPAQHDLLVADSFRARRSGGRTQVRGLSRHIERFRQSVLHVATAKLPEQTMAQFANDLEVFIADALPRIGAYGDGFPRLELLELTTEPASRSAGHVSLRLRVALRPLPRLRNDIELRTAGDVALWTPAIKGPNIPTLARVNGELNAEALLVDSAGNVREGATTSVIWWCGHAGHAVHSGDRVPSVTEALLVDIGRRLDMPISSARVTISDLQQCEVWAVNALHGIRPVLRIDDTPLSPPNAHRLERFVGELDHTWESLPTDSH